MAIRLLVPFLIGVFMKNLSKFILAFMALIPTVNLQAQDDLKFELVPYAWLSGIEGDVTVAGRKAEIDVGFSDLFDAVEVGGSFLTVTQYQKWVLWTQLDYFRLDSDEVTLDSARAHIESKSLFLTGAFGYQFETFGDSSTIDVMAGVRYLNMENDLEVYDGGSREGSSNWVDAIFMVRPSFQIIDWIRFNPTMSVGGGDSNLTYELQPQFQFQLSDSISARLGYRRLYYDVGDDKRGFEGSFSGLIAGVGFTF